MPEIRVVIKFDRILASDAGDYICKGDLSTQANTIDVVLTQADVLSDNPFNEASQVRDQFQTNYADRQVLIYSLVLCYRKHSLGILTSPATC